MSMRSRTYAHRRWALLVAAVTAVLAGAGCSAETGTAVPENAAVSTVGGSGATASPTATVDPCAGASGTCQVVRIVDVDGDGTPDPVAIAYSSDAPAPGIAFGTSHITTRVGINGTVHSVTQNVSGSAYPTPFDIFRGAFAISRAHGADLALHLVRGQGNAEQFSVIGWNGAELVPLPQPPIPGATSMATPGIWYLGSSHGKQDSIVCRTPGEIAVVSLSAATQEGIPIPGGGRRTENYFTFSANAWQPRGSDTTADSSFSYAWDAHTNAFRCTPLGTAG